MYDVAHLESQWRVYRRKRVIFPIAIFLLLAGLTLAVYFFWPRASSRADSERSHMKNRTPEMHPEGSQEASIEKTQASSVSSTTVPPHKTKGWKMTFSNARVDTQPPEAVAPKQHVNIQVTTKKSEVSSQEIEERFRFAKNKDDALFLARYYYDKKAYKKALKWALETNKLDSDIEESWLIFGQAKARLGQRMEAIRVLQAYYDRTGSQKAQKLLDAIRRGKTP